MFQLKRLNFPSAQRKHKPKGMVAAALAMRPWNLANS
jgi:hypothetical protein